MSPIRPVFLRRPGLRIDTTDLDGTVVTRSILLPTVANLDEPWRTAWTQWCDQMRVPIDRIPENSWIECNDQTYRITFPMFAYRKPFQPEFGDDGKRLRTTGLVQLESKALPFPDPDEPDRPDTMAG